MGRFLFLHSGLRNPSKHQEPTPKFRTNPSIYEVLSLSCTLHDPNVIKLCFTVIFKIECDLFTVIYEIQTTSCGVGSTLRLLLIHNQQLSLAI